jgi:hypothetical protein
MGWRAGALSVRRKSKGFFKLTASN